MQLCWNDRYINIVGKFTEPCDWDNIEGNVNSKIKNCKKFEFDEVVVKLYRSTVQVLNVKSIDEAENIMESKFRHILNNIKITWRIVNNHNEIQIPKEMLNRIESYIKNNSRYRGMIQITPPKSGTTLTEFTRDIYCYRSGTFGIIFNIYHGIGKMSCTTEDYEHKLSEFISLF